MKKLLIIPLLFLIVSCTTEELIIKEIQVPSEPYVTLTSEEVHRDISSQIEEMFYIYNNNKFISIKTIEEYDYFVSMVGHQEGNFFDTVPDLSKYMYIVLVGDFNSHYKISEVREYDDFILLFSEKDYTPIPITFNYIPFTITRISYREKQITLLNNYL